ncbi:MAG: DUF2202 domain-containing protein, partial [Sulfurimonas sp.]|nr:DUF2202 domain-containing protein [Sulfurimonas sp.]
MIQTNRDEALLLSQKVDLNVPIDSMHQALRIALYDEYHARAVYMKVMERFGSIQPFANIVDAENRHIEELLYLFNKYNLEPPIDDWSSKVQAEATLVENCEMGVAAEI